MKLEYRGKDLDPSPLSLAEIAQALTEKRPVVAVLEPGDASHYAFLLTPANAPGVQEYLDRWGIPSDSAHNYIHVTKLDANEMQAVWVATFNVYPTIHYIDPISDNPHTNAVLQWLMYHVVKTMQEGEETK